MTKIGVELLVDTYPAVLAGLAPRVPQDDARATTMPRRRPEDGRIAWAWPAARILNIIRAVAEPYPGAFVGDGPSRLRLWAAATPDERCRDAEPGTVVAIVPSRGVAVATGAGVLVITRVQDAGGVAEPADRWAARRGLRPGARL